MKKLNYLALGLLPLLIAVAAFAVGYFYDPTVGAYMFPIAFLALILLIISRHPQN